MQILSVVLLVFGVLLQASSIDKNYGTATVTQVTSVHDGDTFRVDIKDYPPIIGKRVPVRVNGIDTPELKGKCQKEKDLAREAKQVTVSLLRAAKTIELKNMKRGKYFRIVADVYVDDRLLADELLSRKLAAKYDGGTKMKDWCTIDK
jgi:endonuclease YncB( thermonuclease family)